MILKNYEKIFQMLHTHRYYKKLQQIKKDMLDLHSKSTKLKNRTTKILERQEKEAEMRRRIQKLKEENDAKLVAKPSTILSKK